MPTGYTAKLCEQDVSFNEFVMTCARAMGACVMMRDEPFDAPMPEEFKPSPYHAEKLAEAEAEIERASKMSDADCEAAALAEFEKEGAHYRQMVEKGIASAARLRAMQAKVKDWVSPSSDHDGLKTFMLEQLATTLNFDGVDDYYQKQLAKLRKKTPTEHRLHKMEKAQKDIDYHHAEYLKEVDRTEKRTAWIKALRISLAK